MLRYHDISITEVNITMLQVNIPHYKDRKCAVNENSLLRIVDSVHYNARDLIVKVSPQTG